MMRPGVWLLVLFATGCARITIYQHTERMLTPVPVPVDHPRFTFTAPPIRWRNRGPYVDLGQECPKGWERLTSDTSFTQALLKLVTLNFYSLWSVEVECAGK